MMLPEHTEPPKPNASTLRPEPAADRAALYVPRILQQHLADDPKGRWWTATGTAAFADVSGFTKLSESLARKGREGAEQITDAIGRVFEAMLSVAYENGGSLLKFGGDALLLWFDGDGHATRACRAALRMRDALRRVGSIELPDTTITLQVSQGVHSGQFHFFAVGISHREMLPVGPGWSRLASAEKAADADEVLVTEETAAVLPPDCLGDAKAPGALLQREPPGFTEKIPLAARPALPHDTLARCLSASIREHVMAGGGTSEHRPVTIAFIRFEGTDTLIEQQGPEAAADALHRVMGAVEAAAEEQDVTFLASDVDADGGKLILTAGAPKVSGSDEERMLLALRKIATSDLPLPIRIGVHRGAVFAGDIGPAYRRTYTVMGDAVNLTARLMAKAERAVIYATGDVLDRSSTLFEVTQLEPFAVKGKAEPVQAWSVGRALGSKARQTSEPRLPLTGRNAELGVIRKAYASARSGAGRLIDVVGEAGMGKTRLLEALRDAAAGFRKLHATCEAYTASVPYALWRELLREAMEIGRDAPDAGIVERLRQELTARAPDLAPWLPLIAIAFGVEVEETPEIGMLAEKNRRAKLHESVAAFLEAVLPASALIEIENAHQMDEASAELLGYLVAEKIASRPWLLAVARRGAAGGFAPPESEAVVRVELKALAAQDALRMAQLATQQNPLPAHVLEVVAKRSGGNPQFLRDLLRTAIESGGVADLPDSAEAATMAQIDGLAPDDRAVVRRASVFGLTFHPRMLAWFAEEGEGSAPDPEAWERLRDLFDAEPDGYLRFRRSLLRDAAYEGLPFKLRRKLHGVVASHLEKEAENPEEVAGPLSLHYFEAGESAAASRYAAVAARRAYDVNAYVEAARLYARALEAGRQLPDGEQKNIATLQEALGDAWYRAGEFQKASEAYVAARPLIEDDPVKQSGLMIKLSHLEEKLGNYAEALRWVDLARSALEGVPGPEAAKQSARVSAWCATVLQAEGKTDEALRCAEQTVAEAEAADEPEALGDGLFVMGWAYGQLGREGGIPLMERALEAYRKAGDLIAQGAALSNLGVVCQWEGRWDEAASYYEQGRNAALKIGNSVGAAVARINVAEILIDRGEWAEAEALLLETLPFWKAAQYRYYLGACLLFLGRASLRLGRFDEALSRLEGARSNFLQVGAEEEIPPVEARIAECRVAMDQLDEALALVDGLLGRAGSSTGVARVVSLLQRIKGHALIRQGDLWGARDALEASLAAAKERRDLFEATLTSLSLIELDRLEGVEPPIEIVDESRSLLASLKVRAVPPAPVAQP